MGIISRIINIAKSNSFNESHNNYSDEIYFDEICTAEDDELKRIIDELNDFNYSEFNHEAKNPKDFLQVKDIRKCAFDVLGINETSDKMAINEAFKNKLKIYHPDKHPNSSKEEKEFYIKKTTELIEAYNELRTKI